MNPLTSLRRWSALVTTMNNLMTERTERKSNAQQLASVSESGVTKSTAVTVTETLISLIFTRCTHDSLHTVVDNGLSHFHYYHHRRCSRRHHHYFV